LLEAHQLLDGLPTHSREVILYSMKQSTSFTLRILRSLYSQANMDVVGEGFTVTFTDKEALKLMEDSTILVDWIVEMILVDKS
jgi:hypothetical protein